MSQKVGWHLFHLAMIACLACTAAAAAAADNPAAPLAAAPADAWPFVRGSLAGTGRSAATLRLPLAEAWRRDFDKTAFGATPVIAVGMIYLGDLDGTFHALALDTGATQWTFKADEAGFPSAAAVSLDPAFPLVVVGDDTGVVRAFDHKTGAVKWTYATDGEISGGPTIIASAAGPRVLVGSQDASLSCLSLADGAVVWKHSIADQIRCAPTVAETTAGPRVFIAGCDGKLHVIDVATGAATAAVAIDGPTGTTPAAAGDRVFFGTEGGGFFAVDVEKLKVAWRMQSAVPGQSYRSSAALTEQFAIVGSRGRAIEAFRLADGGRAWRTPVRGRVDAAPVIVVASGGTAAAAAPREVAIVADAAGKIVAVEAATGAKAWEFDAGGRFDAGPAVAGGRLVIASDDGTVWCFASGDE
jgi:outer membrane protein assembly factor BamB